MNYTDYAKNNQQSEQFPLQLQQIIEQINNIYTELDQAESEVEQQIQSQLKMKKRNVAVLNKLRQDIEKMQIEKVELMKSCVTNLDRLKTDPIISLKDEQYKNLDVMISRYRQLVIGKNQSLTQLINQIQRTIVSTQQVEIETDVMKQDTKESQKLMAIGIELDKHEEELDKDQKEIREIHRDVNEIVSIIDTISVEVHNQGEVVNKIEEKVISADQDMDEGLDELLKAQKNQKIGKKARWIMVILAAVVVLLVVIIVLAVIF